jgi:hypothetical protein
MKPAESNALSREAQVFARYLIGRPPDGYVIEKYLEGHRVAPDYAAGSRFDRLLVKIAASGTIRASLADSYACLLARRSMLRRKLILMLAILESCAPARGFLDAIEPVSRSLVALQLAGRGILFLIRLGAAAVVLLPLQLALGGSRPRGE